MFSAAVCTKKPAQRFPAAPAAFIVNETLVAVPAPLCFWMFVETIAADAPPLKSAPVTSTTVMLQPVRAVPQPLAVTTSFVGEAPEDATHSPVVSTADWNTESSSVYVAPFPDTLVGSVCVASVELAQTMQIISEFAAGVKSVPVAYDVAFVVTLTCDRAVKASATRHVATDVHQPAAFITTVKFWPLTV
jgi:hypothetical protein